MRGLQFPASFLVLACLAGGWGLSFLFVSDPHSEWQPAGLGRAGETLTSSLWPSWAADAEAGDASGEAAGGEVSGTDDRPSVPQARDGDPAPRPSKFSRISIRPGRSANFEGFGEPGRRVELKLDGKSIGSVRISANGTWRLSTLPLGVGDHSISLVTDAGGGARFAADEVVRIAIPRNASDSEIVAYEGPDPEAEARLRSRAERLAEAASREFDTYTQRDERRSAGDREKSAARDVGRSNQSQASSQRQEDQSGEREWIDYGELGDWYSKSAKDYFDYVVPELARKGGSQRADVPPPERPNDSSPIDIVPSVGTLVDQARAWLRNANRTYQDEIVRDLSTGPARQPDDETAAEHELAVKSPQADGSIQDERNGKADELRRENERRLAAEARERDRLRRVSEAQAQAEREQAERELEEKRQRESAEEQARLAQLEDEKKRRLEEILAERERQKSLAERERLAADLEAQRQRSLAEEQARLAERDREKALEEKRLAAERAEQEAERWRQEEAARIERDRLAKLEAEEQAAERARLAQLELDKQAGERAREAVLKQRIEREAARRLDAKVNRLNQIARLSDQAGYGRGGNERESSGKAVALVEPELPERRDELAASKAPARNAEAISVPDRQAIQAKSRRADELADLFEQAYRDRLRQIRRDGEVPLPADPEVRREALRYASRLGGPQKDRAQEPVSRTAGWRARGFQPARGTGCKDRRAGRTIRVPGTYVVARGDTLWHISRRHYRRGYRYGLIYRANRKKIRHPHWIYPCQKFWLPRR